MILFNWFVFVIIVILYIQHILKIQLHLPDKTDKSDTYAYKT